ncbi:zinc-binding dehydrogenase [Rhizobium leguminosarum]|uniref:zinc-binding dehydrogenase n=1 Tax=Rhizobium leguminosarum TaxID=384 RepID=UPI00247B02ED|nr:zinc-binding dehydrogenase [Rhizobium leguminosarum]
MECSWVLPRRDRPSTELSTTSSKAAAAGEIQVVIDRTFALQDASKAHDYAETGRPLGRVIMTP